MAIAVKEQRNQSPLIGLVDRLGTTHHRTVMEDFSPLPDQSWNRFVTWTEGSFQHEHFSAVRIIVTDRGRDFLRRQPEVTRALHAYPNLPRVNIHQQEETLGQGNEGHVTLIRTGSRRHITLLAGKLFYYTGLSSPSHEKIEQTLITNEALASYLQQRGYTRIQVPVHIAGISIRDQTVASHLQHAIVHELFMEYAPGVTLEKLLATHRYVDEDRSFEVSQTLLDEIVKFFEKVREDVHDASARKLIPGGIRIPRAEWAPKNCTVHFDSSDPNSWRLYVYDQGPGPSNLPT